MQSVSTLVELLRMRATVQGDEPAFFFLADGQAQEQRITYAELDARARTIAVRLTQMDAVGERVLLLYPPGLDYIAAFLGCQYAGAVAVPAYPPKLNRSFGRLQSIVGDCQVLVSLTTKTILDAVSRNFSTLPDLQALRWMATDSLDVDGEAWSMPAVTADSLAFLQYTSGSTGAPKGVMLSHRNLLHNLEMIATGFQTRATEHGCIWLPPYHDMGLIGGILEPLYGGFPCTLMPPTAFLQSPFRWLQAISQRRATASGGPDFAYELCVRKITEEQKAELDLSCWRLAFTGAEPIRSDTLERFSKAFAACGFDSNAFYPCYGLAEGTLFVTGSAGPEPSRPVHVDRDALERHAVVTVPSGADGTVTLIGCGKPFLDQELMIVNPQTAMPCGSNQVGEIWVAGPSVAQGYWNRQDETEAVFRAHLANSGKGPFLRTGDLGFVQDQELYVTGRLKDLIIIRGRNYYPHDIERTAEASCASVRPGCGAAFSVEIDGTQRLVVVFEVERHLKATVDEISRAVRQAIAEEFDLQLHALVLIKQGSLPKTSSGKTQRYACRLAFLEGTLEAVAQSVQPQELNQASSPLATGEGRAAIEGWIVAALSQRLGLASTQIDVNQPFSAYGLDSLQAVELSGELQARLGRTLPATLAYDHPTVTALAAYLAGELPSSQPDAAQAARPSAGDEPIAVIGLGCRFPGAPDPESFWQLLCDGKDAITSVPPDRWDAAALFDPDPASPGKMTTTWGGFLDSVDQFDPAFFGITPREAARMDPQQRLMLEVVWEALEDVGIPAEQLAGSQTGVFVGISTWDYAKTQLGRPDRIDAYSGTSLAHSIAANRISYLLDLRGPSMALDTACSSALVSIHAACQSLRNGESSLALAGGVNVILSPDLGITFCKAGAMAPDGRCKAFDARANGYVRSEGAGVVVLKRLSQALDDGDSIYAIIRGSAVNQDGRSNGLMAPNGPAQEAVLRAAYRTSGIVPGHVQYVETHGTGTALGDPIEVNALGAVLAEGRPPGRPCAIGSGKTNIGHLEAAAGVAGFIKVVLALKHKQLPPSLHFQQPNPHIAFHELPLTVQTALSPWPALPGERMIAGVSSFGFGGTNCHVVLEGPPTVTPATDMPPPVGRPELLVLSARAPRALNDLARKLADRIRAGAAGKNLADLCYSAARKRSHHGYRSALVAGSQEEMLERLDEVGQIGAVSSRPAARRPVAFVFSGQGSQWRAMGRTLLEREPVFRSVLERCDRWISHHAGWSLLDELLADEASSRLDRTEFNQPVLVAVQVALAELWQSWGIEPDAVVGHSMGEISAACVSGALSLEDAMRVAFHRGRLMKRAEGHGKMAAVALRPEAASVALAGYETQIAVAAYNSPASAVLSGEPAALEAVVRSLEAEGIFCRMLRVDLASHSPQMDLLQAELVVALAELRPTAPTVPVYSTVTGRRADASAFDAAYWGRNLREPVRFSDAIQDLVAAGCSTFLEISPHPILLSPIQEVLHAADKAAIVLPSLRRGEPERRTLLQSLGTLYINGVNPCWERVYPSGNYEALPLYPWQRERHWVDGAVDGGADGAVDPLLGRRVLVAANSAQDIWEVECGPGRLASLHVPILSGEAVPDEVFWTMASAAAARGGIGQYQVTAFVGVAPLVLHAAQRRVVQLLVSPADPDGTRPFAVYSRLSGGAPGPETWTLHATGTVNLSPAPQAATLTPDWCYRLNWHPRVQDRPYAPTVPGLGTWLILTDSDGIGDGVAADLRRQGATCLLVRPAADYTRVSEDVYELDPLQPNHMQRLLADAVSDGGEVRGMVHLWSITGGAADWEAQQAMNCGAVLHAVQALARSGRRLNQRLCLVTRGAWPVGTGHRDVAVSAASLWGLGATVAMEYPEFRCLRVDLDPNGAVPAERLVAEMLSDSREDQVAFRDDLRYVARLERMYPPKVTTPVSVRPNRTYLISGGLTGIGLYLAQRLVEAGARHLILLGRRAPQPDADAILAELRQEGAQIMVAQADVSDWDQLARVLDEAGAVMPTLCGIIHAAGVNDGALLRDLTWDRFRAVMRPKVAGAWNLHLLSRTYELDMFALFSSAASVLGLRSQGNYAAANAFMDALAALRQGTGRPALSVNWGPWSDIGMVAGRAMFGLEPHSPEEGYQALMQLQAGGVTQAAVFKADWERLLEVYPLGKGTPLFANLAPQSTQKQAVDAGSESSLRADIFARAPHERHKLIETHLIQHLAHVLGYAPSRIDPNVSLQHQGLDSLIALELKSRLERDLRIAVPLVRFLQGCSLSELAEELVGLLEMTRPAELETVRPELAPQPAGGLLANLDNLSDGDVEVLLRHMMADEEESAR